MRLIVKFRDPGTLPHDVNIAALSFSKVALSDGTGAPAELRTEGAQFTLDNTGRPLRDDWADVIRGDRTQPEPFTIELLQDKTIFEGNHFIVFSTLDKQSGIDHYEVLEVREKKDIESPYAQWRTATSPHELQDQNRLSYVFVKAIDKAGNERIEEIAPSAQAVENRFIFWIVSSAAILILFFLRIFRIFPV
jgi:hypothetical protein